MEKPYLLFKLIQNMAEEYPEFSPYSVIKLAKKGDKTEGYSSCDEYGRTDFSPGLERSEGAFFKAANEETVLAFLGKQRKNDDGTISLWVTYDKSIEEDLEKLNKEYYPKEWAEWEKRKKEKKDARNQ